jgi:MFS family permease
MKIFEFQKERSIDNIIEASFKLLRKHFKPMFSILRKYNSAIIIAFFISYFLYFYLFFGRFSRIFASSSVFVNKFDATQSFNDPKFIAVILVLLITSLLFYPRFYATIMGYIRVYKENNGVVEPEKVNEYIKGKFWGLIGLSFYIGIIVFVIIILVFFLFSALLSLGTGAGVLVFFGFIAFFLFAVYISITLSLVFPIYFFDDTSPSESLSLSFKYIKNKWWFSFWVLFVVGLIIGLLGLAVNMPVNIYATVKDLSVIDESNSVNTIVSQSGDIIVSLLSVLSLIVEYILKVVYLIALALLYFSLKEYHTQEGILGKIDSIGKQDNNEI